MTIELSRRLFLFGSAAALAAAAVPVAIAGSVIKPPVFTPVQAMSPYLRRVVWGADIGFEFADDAPNDYASVDIGRGPDRPILHFDTSTRSVLSWVAHPLSAIIVPANDTLSVSLRSARGLGSVILTCADVVDEGPPIRLIECHTFPQRGPAEIVYLDVDNSLEARLERKKAAEEAAARAPEEDEHDDYYCEPGALPTRPWR